MAVFIILVLTLVGIILAIKLALKLLPYILKGVMFIMPASVAVVGCLSGEVLFAIIGIIFAIIVYGIKIMKHVKD